MAKDYSLAFVHGVLFGETFPKTVLEDPDEEEDAADDDCSDAKVVHVVSDFLLEVADAVGGWNALVNIQCPVEDAGVANAAASILVLEVGQDFDTSVDCLRVGHACCFGGGSGLQIVVASGKGRVSGGVLG